MKYTICNECPCLSSDNEYGEDCSLGFELDCIELVEHGWGIYSTNCGLTDVRWVREKNDGVKIGMSFEPEIIEDEEKPKPVSKQKLSFVPEKESPKDFRSILNPSIEAIMVVNKDKNNQ